MEIRRFMNNNNNNHHQQSKSGSTKMKITTMSSDQSRRSNNNTKSEQQKMPDLTDFMNDMFFGTDDHKKSYNLTGNRNRHDRDHQDHPTDEDEGPEVSPRRSVSGKMTQEWLDEARRMVASNSPSRCDSPTRLVGSPRFAAVSQGPASLSSSLDRRDPLSRSARRYRAVESFSGEIISKTTKHNRNKSETFMLTDTPDSSTESSPTATVHQWFSNILKPLNPTPPPPQPQPTTTQNSTNALARRQSFPRQSRFKANDDRPSSPRPQGIPAPPGRTVQSPSPFTDPKLLSPPKSLVESAQRRSISSSTCSTEKILFVPKKQSPEKNYSSQSNLGINGFLRDQRAKLNDGDSKARIVLSGPSNSASSMVASICYAWLLENRKRKEKMKEEEFVIVPVMNLKRETMWKLKEVSWLFYHLNLDVSSLFFADEVDLEGLMMDGKLSMVVIGQDVLRINGEVRSQCTILTDNYCEEAYDLLQNPILKKLLLAAILLDTENLNSSPQVSMTRDAEAVQLLLVGSAPNYRNTLFDQLTQNQRDESFFEAMVKNYGKPPNENDNETDKRTMDDKVSERKSTSHRIISVQNSNTKSHDPKNTKPNKVSPKSDKPISLLPQVHSAPQVKATTNPDSSRVKNKFSLAKWFGFGSK